MSNITIAGSSTNCRRKSSPANANSHPLPTASPRRCLSFLHNVISLISVAAAMPRTNEVAIIWPCSLQFGCLVCCSWSFLGGTDGPIQASPHRSKPVKDNKTESNFAYCVVRKMVRLARAVRRVSITVARILGVVQRQADKSRDMHITARHAGSSARSAVLAGPTVGVRLAVR